MKADHDGTEMQEELRKLHDLMIEIQNNLGGIADGPYFPQDGSVL